MGSQTKVLASNKLPTYEKPEQHRLHHWRLSWEKKVCDDCHHSRLYSSAMENEEIENIPFENQSRHWKIKCRPGVVLRYGCGMKMRGMVACEKGSCIEVEGRKKYKQSGRA